MKTPDTSPSLPDRRPNEEQGNPWCFHLDCFCFQKKHCSNVSMTSTVHVDRSQIRYTMYDCIGLPLRPAKLLLCLILYCLLLRFLLLRFSLPRCLWQSSFLLLSWFDQISSVAFEGGFLQILLFAAEY